MPRFRVSISALLATIAVVAIGLAGMVSASRFWTAAAATVALGMLLSAVLAARLLDGPARAFWMGFALFGWSYLLLVNWDWIGGQFGHDLSAGLNEIAEGLFSAPPPGPAPPPQYFELNLQRRIKIGNFVQITRLIICMMFALLGGIIARTLVERRGFTAGTPTAGQGG